MFRKICGKNDKEQIMENEILSFGKEPEDNLAYQNYIDTNNTFGIFSAKGKLKASLSIYPQNVIFRNINLHVLGIGHVATRPEFRNQGYMKKLLKQVLMYGRDNKYDVSILYPYSCMLYEGVGFRICEYRHKIQLELEQIKQMEVQGCLEKYETKQEDSVDKLYKKYLNFLNAGEIKQGVLSERNIKGQVRFFWSNKKKIKKSFIEFILDNEKNLKINKFYFFDNEGLYGMFSALKVFSGRYKKLIWEIPIGININQCISKMENVIIETSVKTMVRIINLENVLLKIPYRCKNNMYLEIIDPVIHSNTGIYMLSKRGNKKIHRKNQTIQVVKMSIDELTSILFEENRGINNKHELRLDKLKVQLHVEQYF